MGTKFTAQEWAEVYQAAAEVIGQTQKHTPSSTTLTAPYLHGPFQGNAAQFGIFSDEGIRPEMFATLVRPTSLASVLGVSKSRYVKERYDLFSGVTEASGTNATGWCGDPPVVGQGKVCEINFEWGDYYVKTNLNAAAQLGDLRDRREVPRQILNMAPVARNPFVPEIMYRLDDTQSQFQYEMWLIGVELERSMEKLLVRGNSAAAANNTLGWITEFDGLDQQIKTGIISAKTGNLCPAADSAVKSFDADVSGNDANGDNIVQATTDLYYGVRQRANSMGMPTTQFAFVTRQEAFRALVEQYACSYLTYRCSGTATEPLNEDTLRTNDLRLRMMQDQYLLVDNVQVPVIFSEGVEFTSLGNNKFKSDLYLIPLSWEGFRLLRLDHFPMDNEYIGEFMNAFDMSEIGVLNNGLYLVGRRSTGLCLEWHFQSRMRLILETPWLAGRLDNIQYTFRAPIRTSDPADTWFYADGGDTYLS